VKKKRGKRGWIRKVKKQKRVDQNPYWEKEKEIRFNETGVWEEKR